MAIDIGTGATITFGTTGWAGTILSIGWHGVSRNKIKTTHLGTAALSGHTYLAADIYEPGEMEIEYQQDTAIVLSATSANATYKTPPFRGPAETITIKFPPSGALTTPAQYSGSGFVTSLDVDWPLDELITGKFTVSFTGSVTPASAV